MLKKITFALITFRQIGILVSVTTCSIIGDVVACNAIQYSFLFPWKTCIVKIDLVTGFTPFGDCVFYFFFFKMYDLLNVINFIHTGIELKYNVITYRNACGWFDSDWFAWGGGGQKRSHKLYLNQSDLATFWHFDHWYACFCRTTCNSVKYESIRA